MIQNFKLCIWIIKAVKHKVLTEQAHSDKINYKKMNFLVKLLVPIHFVKVHD